MNKQLKTTYRILTVAMLLSATPQLMAQQDELNAIGKKLAAGNCEGAQKVYELYSDNYPANPAIERQIAECLQAKNANDNKDNHAILAERNQSASRETAPARFGSMEVICTKERIADRPSKKR